MKIQRWAMLVLSALVVTTAAETVGHRPLSDIPAGKKYIALTFDDGPNTQETVQILDELKRLNTDAKVTFYINGSRVNDETRPVLHRTIIEGHDVDNHGYFHYSHGGNHLDSKDENGNLIILDTPEKARENIQRNSQLIYDETGYWPFSFRAPFFEWETRLNGLDKILNMPFVQTFYDSNDWGISNQSNPEKMASDLLNSSKIVSGAIILMHDGPAGSRPGTVASLQHFIPQLIERGFFFVTVRELFALRGKQPEQFMYPDTWNPNNGVPFNPIQDKVRYSHVDFWPDNIDDWMLQDWWTCSTPPWERDLSEPCDGGTVSTVQQAGKATGSAVAISGISSKEVNLTVPSAGTYTISIFSVNGKLLSQQRKQLAVGANSLVIDNAMAKGVAVVRVQGADAAVVQKLIVQ